MNAVPGAKMSPDRIRSEIMERNNPTHDDQRRDQQSSHSEISPSQLIRAFKTHQFEWIVQVEMEVTGVGEIVQQMKVLKRTLAWILAKDNGTSPKAE